MSERQDSKIYLDSPELLLELCRDVIGLLDVRGEGPELDECQSQLREIARTVENLEKRQIKVPDELRRLKTELVAKMAICVETNNTLMILSDGFGEILQSLQAKTGRKIKGVSRGTSTERVKKHREKMKNTVKLKE